MPIAVEFNAKTDAFAAAVDKLRLQPLSTALTSNPDPVWGGRLGARSFFTGTKIMAATPQQILDVLKACKDKPQFPSQVDVEEFNPYDPTHQQRKQGLFAELHSQGLLQHVRDPKGRRTPLGYQLTPKGQAELDLLSKHPAIAGQKVADPTAKNRGSLT